MAKKYLDYDGLLYFWQKIKANFVTDVTYNSTSKKIQKTKSGSTSDVVTLATVATSGDYGDLSNKPTIPSGVEKTTTTPLMDGTAAIGSETKFAAGDHVHPSDTSKADVTATVSSVTWDSTNRKIQETINGATTDVVTLATVATSGSYNDLSNKPTIPSVSDALKAISGTTQVSKYLTVTNKGETLSNQTLIKAQALGAADGVCPLDANSKVDAQYLPSYVDDVIEAYPRSGATELSSTWLSLTSGGSALTPESGKIYILMADSTSYATNTQFRWSGTAYVKMLDGGVSSITNAEIDTIVAS